MVNYVCVLKKGGFYDERYVDNLLSQLRLHLPSRHHFFCFSDCCVPLKTHFSYPLIKNLKGWWSKLEPFRIFTETPTVFLDLDIAIRSDLSSFNEKVSNIPKDSFYMAAPFNKREEWSSWIMAWNGNFSFLFDEITEKNIVDFDWDQRYISWKVKEKEFKIRPIQDLDNRLHSYKIHGIPENSLFVSFHGKTRDIKEKCLTI